MQAERTALAWTRTALAIAASGVLVLLRDGSVAGLDRVRVSVVSTVIARAAVVYGLGALRRRQLLARPGHSAAAGRRYLPVVGVAVVMQAALVVGYVLV